MHVPTLHLLSSLASLFNLSTPNIYQIKLFIYGSHKLQKIYKKHLKNNIKNKKFIKLYMMSHIGGESF